MLQLLSVLLSFLLSFFVCFVFEWLVRYATTTVFISGVNNNLCEIHTLPLFLSWFMPSIADQDFCTQIYCDSVGWWLNLYTCPTVTNSSHLDFSPSPLTKKIKNPSPQYGYFLVGRVGWIVVKWITTTTTTAATHPLCVRGKGFWVWKMDLDFYWYGFSNFVLWILSFGI